MSEQRSEYTARDQVGEADVVTTLIREIATLQEERERVVKPIEARLKKARDLLKDAMTEADQSEAIDEVSGYRAYIRQSASDEYVADKLLPLLRPEDRERVLDTTVYIKSDEVQRLVNEGILTRSRLEREGALVRRLRARSLYIEPLKRGTP